MSIYADHPTLVGIPYVKPSGLLKNNNFTFCFVVILVKILTTAEPDFGQGILCDCSSIFWFASVVLDVGAVYLWFT